MTRQARETRKDQMTPGDDVRHIKLLETPWPLISPMLGPNSCVPSKPSRLGDDKHMHNQFSRNCIRPNHSFHRALPVATRVQLQIANQSRVVIATLCLGTKVGRSLVRPAFYNFLKFEIFTSLRAPGCLYSTAQFLLTKLLAFCDPGERQYTLSRISEYLTRVSHPAR